MCFRVLIAPLILSVAGAHPPELTIISNPDGQIQVSDHNHAGTALLTRDVGRNGVFFSEFVVRKTTGETVLPIPPGYTAIHAYQISDSNVVVGHCARPGDGKRKNNLNAVVWHVDDNRAELLPTMKGFHSSSAFDISADATAVSGYLIGSQPAKLVPCVWLRESDVWQCRRLPSPQEYNPFLVSSKVVISDDGKQVAASCVVAGRERLSNHLFRWQRSDRAWKRDTIAKRGFRLSNINDLGMIAASGYVAGVSRAFVFDQDGVKQTISPFEGDFQTFALDLNNRGQVVGYSDDPFGAEGGPEAFLWERGNCRRIEFPKEVQFSSATSINDQSQVGGFLISQENGAATIGAFILTPAKEK